MTCSACGAYVTPSVRFCSNCGAPVDTEQTRIAHLQSRTLESTIDGDLERTVFTVKPTMIFVKAGYALAVLGGIALVFLLASIGVSASISIPLALALLLIPVAAWFGATVLRGRRDLFAHGVLVTAIVALTGLNTVNPDGLIVRSNLALAQSGRAFDADSAQRGRAA